MIWQVLIKVADTKHIVLSLQISAVNTYSRINENCIFAGKTYQQCKNKYGCVLHQAQPGRCT